jgi:hypothetical protein
MEPSRPKTAARYRHHTTKKLQMFQSGLFGQSVAFLGKWDFMGNAL